MRAGIFQERLQYPPDDVFVSFLMCMFYAVLGFRVGVFWPSGVLQAVSNLRASFLLSA